MSPHCVDFPGCFPSNLVFWFDLLITVMKLSKHQRLQRESEHPCVSCNALVIVINSPRPGESLWNHILTMCNKSLCQFSCWHSWSYFFHLTVFAFFGGEGGKIKGEAKSIFFLPFTTKWRKKVSWKKRFFFVVVFTSGKTWFLFVSHTESKF